MSTPTKRVVRFNLWIDPVFDAKLKAEADIELTINAIAGSDAAAWAALERAHVYQISPAKNELPKQWQATGTLLERCPDLLCVSSSGAGHDTVDVPACTRAGVAVVNQVGGNAIAVGEHALGLMIALSRFIIESDRRLKTIRGFSREELMGHELHSQVLGIVGIGHTGQRTATLARAFGMEVLAVDPLLSAAEIQARGATPVDMPTLLARSDIVSLHCPREPNTLNMFDERAFAAMKRGALFISTARGGIHDEQALYAALKSGHLAGAGLDVWEPEPPPLDHPLLSLNNVIATYHTAGVSHEGRRAVATMSATQIIDVLHGVRPPRLANPDVWPAYTKRFKARFGKAPV
jgi:D-3-phosphoglycerate dehydrogenase